jgi:hypothetical protein
VQQWSKSMQQPDLLQLILQQMLKVLEPRVNMKKIEHHQQVGENSLLIVQQLLVELHHHHQHPLFFLKNE